MTQYLFSALDLAFFTLLHRTDLPEVVRDPLEGQRSDLIMQWQNEFLDTQQNAGLLTRYGNDVAFNPRLARVFSCVYNASYALKLLNSEKRIQTQGAKYDKIFYIHDDGVAFLKYDSGMYRLVFYKSKEDCYNVLLDEFHFMDYTIVVDSFKVIDTAEKMDSLLKNFRENNNNAIAKFACERGIDSNHFKESIKCFLKSKNTVSIEYIRNEHIKQGGIMIKADLKSQIMMRFIASPDGNLISFESFPNGLLWEQICEFEGK